MPPGIASVGDDLELLRRYMRRTLLAVATSTYGMRSASASCDTRLLDTPRIFAASAPVTRSRPSVRIRHTSSGSSHQRPRTVRWPGMAPVSSQRSTVAVPTPRWLGRLPRTHPEPFPQLGDGFDLATRQARLGPVRAELSALHHVRDRRRMHAEQVGCLLVGDRVGWPHGEDAMTGRSAAPLHPLA